MPERNEPDDEARELAAAVEAEYQAGLRRAEAVNRMQSGISFAPSSRGSIRRRLKRERKEAREARLLEVQLAEAERRRPAVERGDAAPAHADDLLGGLPYVKADYEAAGKLHRRDKMTVAGVEKRGLSTKRAYRIYRQFRAGAVVYDDAGLHPGPGYRWDPDELGNDPPRYKLIHG